MRFTRIAATLVIAFLFGGGLAETYLDTRDAIERQRSPPEEGSAGELVALELQDAVGQPIARPRMVVTPGRAVEVIVRNPDNPAEVRVALRLQTERQPSGDVTVNYRIVMPLHAIEAAGLVSVTPGVEQAIDLGEVPFGATILTVPVPSAAFDAYLQFERTRTAITRI